MYLVIKVEDKEFPDSCCNCPLIFSDDCDCEWYCGVTKMHLNNPYKLRIRGCPIKGRVKESNIIKYNPKNSVKS